MRSVLKNFSTAMLGMLCLVIAASCETSSSNEVRKLSRYNRKYDSYQQDFVFKSDDFSSGSTLAELKEKDIVYKEQEPSPAKSLNNFPKLEYVQEETFFDRKKYVDYRNSGMSKDEARKAAERVTKKGGWEFTYD